MLTLLLLILTTALGAVIGNIGWAEPWMGALFGFVVGMAIRFGVAPDDVGFDYD